MPMCIYLVWKILMFLFVENLLGINVKQMTKWILIHVIQYMQQMLRSD